MRMRDVAVSAFATCMACSPVSNNPDSGQFVLCREGSADKMTIGVNKERISGNYGDFATLIKPCGDLDSGCIDFPLRMSTPPRLPDTGEDPVRWSVDNYRFALRSASGGDGFVMRVEGTHPTGASVGPEFYTYDERKGVTSFKETDDGGNPVTWVRCSGRLRFEDLPELRRKLALPEEELRKLVSPR